MKTTAVSVTVWMAQVLMTCSLNSTTNTDPSTTAQQMTTSWTTVPTASLSADNFLTDQSQSITDPSGTEVSGFKTQNDFTNTTDNDSTINSIQHNITSPEVVTVSLNSTSLAIKNDYPETGTVTRVTLQEHTVTTGPSAAIQLDHAVQTTSFLTWTEGRRETSTSNPEASSTTASMVTWKDEINESTEYYEITPTTDHSIQVQTLNVESTQSTEEPLVSATDVSKTPDAQTDQKTTEDHSTAQTTNTYNSINTTRSDDTTRTEVTDKGITTATNSTETQGTTTAEATTSEGITTATKSTKTQNTTTAEATMDEDLTVTLINLNNVTNITETQRATRTEASYTWTTLVSITNTSENISETETKWTLWPDCYNEDKDVSVTSGRSSKLVCFVTLWSLGMTASIFLGLTIFLWVRLSVIKKRSRLKGSRDKGGQRAAKERESLWAEHYTSAEDRVEFWYANGTTLEVNKKGSKRQKKRPVKTKDERKEENEEDLWIQPKVTLQDITDFWRVRNVDVDAS